MLAIRTIFLITALLSLPLQAATKPVRKTLPVKTQGAAVRTPASATPAGVSSTPQVKTRVRSISGVRHINASFVAAQQGTGSVTTLSLGWGPRLLRTEGAFFEVRANLGAVLLKRISPSSLFFVPELWVLGSVRLNDKLRFEAGPLLQYWMTTDQGLNLGGTFQLAYEVKWVTYFDRLQITYQPVFNKVALVHFIRLGLGFSF